MLSDFHGADRLRRHSIQEASISSRDGTQGRYVLHLVMHVKQQSNVPLGAVIPFGDILRRSHDLECIRKRAYPGLLTVDGFLTMLVSQLMAAGILSHMEGKLGIRAWRWYVYRNPSTRSLD